MENDVVFRPLTSGDIEHVAANLCAGDRATLADLFGGAADPQAKIYESVLLSARCEAVARPGGDPLALVGVVPVSLIEGTGLVWMTATEEAFVDVRNLVRAGRRHVKRLEEQYPRLLARDDARQVGTIKWLKLLGFREVGDETVNGVKFIHFERWAG